MAAELALQYASVGSVPGLPGQMIPEVRKAAQGYLRARDWVFHLMLCLLLVQARTGQSEPAETVLRLELESILMSELYGPIVRSR